MSDVQTSEAHRALEMFTALFYGDEDLATHLVADAITECWVARDPMALARLMGSLLAIGVRLCDDDPTAAERLAAVALDVSSRGWPCA